MTENQTCPLCGRILYEGLEGWLYHMNDNDPSCVINSFTSDELIQATSQITHIKEAAFKEGCLKAKKQVLEEMRKFSKGLTCDETCKNNPKSCEMEQRMIRAFDIIEEQIKKKHGVE